MKQIYTLILAIIFSNFCQCQIVNIPDANLKNALVNDNVASLSPFNWNINSNVDTNGDGEIQVSEATQVFALNLPNLNISSIEGIQYFTSLEYLSLYNNLLTSIDLSQNLNLKALYVNSNQLNALDTSYNTNLETISCNNNQLSVLDLSSNLNLNFLNCENNQIQHLDLSQNINLNPYDDNPNNLSRLKCKNNQMQTLILKNGINNVQTYAMLYNFFEGNETLTYICDDDENLYYLELLISSYYPTATTTVNSYCSFNPGGVYYNISGHNTYDLNGDGCDVLDMDFPFLKYNVTDGSINEYIYANSSGNYNLPVAEGVHTITPELENLDYFTVVPASLTVDFPINSSPYSQDFCITPDGVHNDLEVILIPLEDAMPGFDSDYEIIYKNNGNQTLSGDLTLTFNDDLMNLVSVNPVLDNQTVGELFWTYSNLLPFESRSIQFTMNINTPTDSDFPVNQDDILQFTSSITPFSEDETMENNYFELNQTVVNSYDPNDKTCLEGNTIPLEKVGDYVNYLIRFENLGTADATNIVIKDEIDVTKFDITTLRPTYGSHQFVTSIEDNVVEFIFEDINLPFDDANNDGYVVFKIKTLSSLVLNDIFENTAEIYFDYNAPIITNTEVTTVSNILSVESFDIEYNIEVYPNPVKSKLYINSQSILKSVSIYDISGRKIQDIKKTNSSSLSSINFENLSKGIYFIKVISENGQLIKKVVKD